MVYIGEIVNTHGIKGELRIISDFKFKEEAFKIGKKFYLGKRHQEVIVKSYRKHKMFDMVTFEGVNNINEAIAFKGDDVFVKRTDLNINGYVDEDLINCEVYNEDLLIGKVESILKNKQEILVIRNKDKKHMIPLVDEFILNVDVLNKRITVKVIEGLINEN